MERFNAHTFYGIARVLERFQAVEISPDTVLRAENRVVTSYLPELKSKCDEIGLRLSSRAVVRMMERVAMGDVKISEWKAGLPEIQNRIQDEMAENLFMLIPAYRAQYYDKQEPFGADVSKNFPSATFDSKEAGNCFASGRFTACVFHLMRALEIGLVTFAGVFPAVPTNKENWQQIIEKIESEIREMPKAATKAPDWKEKQEKYSQVANNFMFFKDAWRNYTAHARGKYTEDEADAIYRNVRSFMQGLATIGLTEW